MPQPARLIAASGASKPKRRRAVIGNPLDALRAYVDARPFGFNAVLIQQHSRAAAAECSRMFVVTRMHFAAVSLLDPTTRHPFGAGSDKARSGHCRTAFSFG